MNKIKIGWSEVSIVPEGKKVDLAGQFYERISDVVETPISVTALAMECGADSVIFCSCDLPSTSHALLQRVRDRLDQIFADPPLADLHNGGLIGRKSAQIRPLLGC